MENSFQTSFIPKKPIVENGIGVSSSMIGKTTSISILVTAFILVSIVVATAGLYFYRDYLKKNKEDLSATLFKMRSSFDSDTIAALELYDKKVTAGRHVLGSHIVLSPLFKSINDLTISSIQYTKFDHSTKDGVFSVKMSGVARDYKSIALQADVFNAKGTTMFKDIIFSNLTKDKMNNVTFDLEFDVDPSMLSYSNSLSEKLPLDEESKTDAEANSTNNNNDPLQTTIDNTQ